VAAGLPRSKLVLGVPAYGYAYSVNKLSAFKKNGQLKSFPAFTASAHLVGDGWDDPNPGPDVCGNNQTAGGVWDYWGLIKAGYLGKTGDPAKGICYTYDTCSQSVRRLPLPRGDWC
jgi:chitinase